MADASERDLMHDRDFHQPDAAAQDGPITIAEHLEFEVPIEEPERQKSGRRLIAEYQKAARANQLYPRNSKIRTDMVSGYIASLIRHVETYEDFSLKIRASVILDGEVEIYSDSHRQRSLAFRLFLNGVRRISFSPGIDQREAEGLVQVLTRTFDAQSTTDDLRTLVWEKSFEHVTFRITDDLLNDREQQELQEFLQQGEVNPESAQRARDESQALVNHLRSLPESTDENLYRLEPRERIRLAAQIAVEQQRDLLTEYAELLLGSISGAADEGVADALDRFLAHVLEDGDLLRAARMLDALRKMADRTRDHTRRDLLVRAIERVGNAHVVPRLEPLIQELLGSDRPALMMLLTAIGSAAVPALCDLLATKARGPAEKALEALLPRHVRALVPFVSDDRTLVAAVATRLIGVSGAEDVVGALLPSLRHASSRVRIEGLKALVALSPERACTLCLQSLKDDSYEVRAVALQAIAEVRPAQAAHPLLERVQDRAFANASAPEQRETYRTLGRIGTSEIMGFLGRTLAARKLLGRAKHDEQRALAALALGLTGSPAARRLLQGIQDDKSPIVRRAVAAALSDLAKPASD